MNYELAKQLKDAGFPQGEIGLAETLTKKPTLSELIEACGEDLTSIVRRGSKWVTNYFEWNDALDEEWTTEGSTPEEAVANLWLELNK